MKYFILDFVIFNILHVNINTFAYEIHNIKFEELVTVALFNLVLNETIIISVMLVIIYILNKIVYKYLNKTLLTTLCTYTFYYIIINPIIDICYFISLLIVIILNIDKYTNNGEYNGTKKISYKSI